MLAVTKAMPALFALSKEKIASQNLGSLFLTNSLKINEGKFEILIPEKREEIFKIGFWNKV